MIEAPLALAFAAGLVATVNPCGFAMLPAYLSYFMGIDSEDQGTGQAIRSALVIGGAVSFGFLVVFGAAGILITAGFRVLIDAIPWVAIVIGLGVIGLGIALVGGYEMKVGLPTVNSGVHGRGYRSVFLFGVSYAMASLSCTLPVFLTVVATQVTRGSLVSGLATFLAYGAGMAVVLMAVSIALAVGKRSLVTWLRGSARYIGRISGAMLIVAGVYIVWFWYVSLTGASTDPGGGGPIAFVEHLSQRAQNMIAAAPVAWGSGFAVVVIIGAGAAFAAPLRNRSAARESVSADE